MSEYSKYYIDDITYFERREKDDMKRIMLKLINKISSQTHNYCRLDSRLFFKLETNKKRW